MTKVFLGGTCNGSLWRDALIDLLYPTVQAYDPVVPDWTPEDMADEIEARNTSDFVLYVITPKMTGVYSIAEVVDDSNKRPYRTLFAVLDQDQGETFTPGQLKSLLQVEKMVAENGGRVFKGLMDIADFLNQASIA